MKNAIGYVRVSTERQGRSGFGLGAQQAQLEAFAKLSGYRLLSIESDIKTGKGEDALYRRPGLKSAVEAAKQHRCPIIVPGLDRLARNTATTEKLIHDEGVKIISCAEGEKADPIVLKSAADRAEFEGKQISDLTKKALKAKKQQGIKLGNPTNLAEAQQKGAAVGRRNANDRAKMLAPVIKEIQSEGIDSMRGIASALDKRGILTSRGKQWSAAGVKNLLKRIDEMSKQKARQEQQEEWGSW